MRLIVIVTFLAISFTSYGKYYPGTLVFENGKSREGFIEANLGDVVLFKGWMESPQPEEVPAAAIKTIWMKTNEGHKIHEYHYLSVEKSASGLWLRSVEKGVVSLYVSENISQQDGVDKTESLDFYCLRQGDTKAKQIASHDNKQVFKSNAPQFFADKHQLVDKIKSQDCNLGNLQELVRTYNQGF